MAEFMQFAHAGGRLRRAPLSGWLRSSDCLSRSVLYRGSLGSGQHRGRLGSFPVHVQCPPKRWQCRSHHRCFFEPGAEMGGHFLRCAQLFGDIVLEFLSHSGAFCFDLCHDDKGLFQLVNVIHAVPPDQGRPSTPMLHGSIRHRPRS